MSNEVQVKLLELMNSLNNKVILVMNMLNINFWNFINAWYINKICGLLTSKYDMILLF